MQVNTVVVHVEINIILRDSINSNIHGQLQNIKNTSLKFKKIGVKNIFISGLVYQTRINILLWKKFMSWFKIFCLKYGWSYVDNRNTRRKHLYKDGLHLMEEG